MEEDHSGHEKPSLPNDEDIDSRFQRIREQLKAMELPDLPEVEQQELHKATSGIPAARQMPDVPELHIPTGIQKSPINPSGDSGSIDYKGLGVGMSAAYSLVGAMAVGLGGGWLVDKALKTTFATAIGGLFGAVLGIVAALIIINRDGGKS